MAEPAGVLSTVLVATMGPVARSLKAAWMVAMVTAKAVGVTTPDGPDRD